MRAPPPVGIDLQPGRPWRLVQAVLHAAAAGAAAAWLLPSLELNAWLPWAPLWLAAAAGAVGWKISASAPMHLQWTGARWQLSPPWAGGPGESGAAAVEMTPPQVMMDLGSWMLLRARPAAGGRSRWLAASRPGDPATWRRLRAAVYSSAPEPALRSTDERPPF